MHLVVQPPQPAPQALPHLGVQRAKRLVEQQHLGFDRERPGQRHPLPLAAGELRRVAVGQALQMDQLQQLRHAVADLLLAGPQFARADSQAEGDILEDGHVPEQRVVLEHETHPPLAGVLACDVVALKQHRAVGVGIRGLQSGDDAQQGGLAGPGWAQQRHQLALVHNEAHVAQSGEAAEGLVDMAYFDGHAIPPLLPMPRRLRSPAGSSPPAGA